MQHDVFISYARKDNLIRPEETEGWVTNFKDSLEIRLTEYLGRKSEVWLDSDRISGDFLTPSIYENLRRSATIVSIVSPLYFASEWCQKELSYYWDQVGARLGNHSRVFFVVKLPPTQIPERFTDLLRLEFFEVTREGVPSSFSPVGNKFKERIQSLAYKISERVRELEAKNRPGKTIYLAETTGDMREKRKNVRNDLIQRDFSVLPMLDEDKPVKTEDYKASVRDDIENCDLAVHLIGKNYGDCPPDDESSYVHLQTLVASERDHDPNFSRLIWMPEDLDQNSAFMEELLASAKKNVDVFRDPSIENLKTRIQDILAGKMNNETGSVNTDKNGEIIPNVYVFCERSDAEDARRLERNLYDLNCEIFTARTLSEDDSQDSLERHEKYLRETNGVLIYWKNPLLQNWIQLIVANLNRKVGYEALGVYLGDNTDERDHYRTHRAQIIKDDAGLSQFVATLRQKLGGNQHAG